MALVFLRRSRFVLVVIALVSISTPVQVAVAERDSDEFKHKDRIRIDASGHAAREHVSRSNHSEVTHGKKRHSQSQLSPGLLGGDMFEEIFKTMKDAIKIAIVAYAALNNGRCPESIPAPGVDPDWMYGAGCGYSGEKLCGCPHFPVYECATSYRFTPPEGLTTIFISAFGYCRIALWIWVTPPILIIVLIVLLCVCRKGKKQEDSDDDKPKKKEAPQQAQQQQPQQQEQPQQQQGMPPQQYQQQDNFQQQGMPPQQYQQGMQMPGTPGMVPPGSMGFAAQPQAEFTPLVAQPQGGGMPPLQQ